MQKYKRDIQFLFEIARVRVIQCSSYRDLTVFHISTWKNTNTLNEEIVARIICRAQLRTLNVARAIFFKEWKLPLKRSVT